MGLRAGISTAPPFLTPPCEEQPAEERPKMQAAALGEGRESKKGAEMDKEGSRDAGLLARGSLLQSSATKPGNPTCRRGMLSLPDGYEQFLWISFAPAQNKSRMQIPRSSTARLQL